MGIVAAAFALDNGGRRNAEEESEENSDEKGDEKNARAGMSQPRECGPEKDGGDGAPGTRTGLEEADAEKGGDGPPAGGALTQVRVFRIFGDTRLLSCLAERFPMGVIVNARCTAKAPQPARKT